MTTCVRHVLMQKNGGDSLGDLICPNCSKRGFGIIKSHRKNSYDTRSKERALFGCTHCDYKEVI